MGYQHIKIEQDGAIATLWLNRPDKLNAMSADMWADIPAAMEALDSDDSVRVVILAGRGSAFTVGIDVEMLAGLQPAAGSQAAGNLELFETITDLQQTATCFARSPKPVIAAVHGYCLGAGMDLITACDVRVAAEDAVFSIRETRMGLVADIGTLQRLPGIVGPGHTAELAYTGKDIDSKRAAAIGLVNDVLPDQASLFEAAIALASEMASMSPLVLRGVKKTLAANDGRTTAEALDYVAQWNASYLFSNDLFEAMTAFVEKRDPDFKGN
ncbi:MAG: crotonase/enoyl-CoA hydratase family protein [Acidimicrobiia bacterium]